MADETAPRGDIKVHKSTYESVMNLLKWGTLASLLVAAFVIWLIA